MFCLRPELTSELSVFKKLCIRRRDEKSSASTVVTRSRPVGHHKLTVYATKGRILFRCKSVLFRVYFLHC